MNTRQKTDKATLEILQVIGSKEDITQRHLASKLDVALGLANSYLKRCVSKGLIKVKQAPANRYLYYLTPKGFAEKSRLTASYLSSSFNFYRDASTSINHIYDLCESKKLNRILFCGVSELAEIASIRSHDYQLEIIGMYDPTTVKKNFFSTPVFNELQNTPNFDACLITALENSQDIFISVINKIDSEVVYTPSILNINRS